MLNADALTLESAVDPIIGHEKHEQPRGGGGNDSNFIKIKTCPSGTGTTVQCYQENKDGKMEEDNCKSCVR